MQLVCEAYFFMKYQHNEEKDLTEELTCLLHMDIVHFISIQTFSHIMQKASASKVPNIAKSSNSLWAFTYNCYHRKGCILPSESPNATE